MFAKVAIRVNAIETEDCAAICFEMASGALVTSSVTLGAAEEIEPLPLLLRRPDGDQPRRAARTGRPKGSGGSSRAAARQQADIDAALAGFVPRQESFAGLFEALHPALLGTAPWPLTLDDAYRSLELVSAIYYSSATNAAVELPLPADHPVRRGWAPWLS